MELFRYGKRQIQWNLGKDGVWKKAQLPSITHTWVIPT